MSVIEWISNYRRRRNIKKYARKLGPLLKRRYGRSRFYSAKQIRTTVHSAGLPVQPICYGYAMFMDREDFDILHRELGETCNYDAMRQEIGEVCFSGNGQFSSSDVVTYGEASHSGGFDGGGFGSSDGGGGGGGGDGG